MRTGFHGDFIQAFERRDLFQVRYALKDFFFRSGLKMEEDEALQQNPKFWEMIEAAKTAAKAV